MKQAFYGFYVHTQRGTEWKEEDWGFKINDFQNSVFLHKDLKKINIKDYLTLFYVYVCGGGVVF